MSLTAALIGVLSKHAIDETLGKGVEGKLGKSLYDWASKQFGAEKAEKLSQIERVARRVAGRIGDVVREAEATETELLNVREALEGALTRINPAAEIVASLHGKNQQKQLTGRLIQASETATLTTREQDFLGRATSEMAAQFLALGPELEGWAQARDTAQLSELRALADRTEGIAGGVEAILDGPAKARADYAAHYRETVADELDYVEILGLDALDRGQREAKLSVAYLSLTTHGRERSGDYREVFRATCEKNLRMLIEGGAGSGKSTLLRWSTTALASISTTPNFAEFQGVFGSGKILVPIREAAERLGKQPITIAAAQEVDPDFSRRVTFELGLLVPILLRLRQYPEGCLPPLEDWPCALCPSLAKPPDGFVAEAMKEGKAVLFFDGVDEIPEGIPREKALTTIAGYARNYTNVPIIIASRPGAFNPKHYDGLHDAEIHTVDDLSHEQQAEFVKNWHAARAATRTADPKIDYATLGQRLTERLRLNPPLSRIATNPLLCAAICALHERQPETLPVDERGLCEKLTMMMLTRDAVAGRGADPVVIEKFGTEYALDPEDRRQLLAYLAHRMVERGRSQVDWTDARDLMPKALKEIDRSGLDPDMMLKALAMRSPPLRLCSGPDGGEAVEFLHNRFKEWLASTWFLGEEEHEALVRHAEKEDYAETLVLAAAAPDRRKYAGRLVGGLMERANAEPARSSLRRSLDVLSLRAALAAPKLSEELRTKATLLQKKLLPPRSMAEAKALSLAGDAVVARLRQLKIPRGAKKSVRCIRCLALIDTPMAREALETYRKESGLTVLTELVRVFDPADLPGVWLANEEGVVNPLGEIRSHIRRLPSLPSETTGLSLSDSALEELSGIEGLAALKWLRLDGTQVNDLAALSGLGALEILDLRGTPVDDLSPLASLTSLTELRLSGTQVANLAPLSGLYNLKWLTLDQTQISDLTPLSGLTALTRLDLLYTQVSDLTPLAGLKTLEILDLNGAPVSDAMPLAGLSGLRKLDLDGTHVRDLKPLAGLTGLQELSLREVPVNDITPLTSLIMLKELSLAETLIDNVAPLSQLKALEYLSLRGTLVDDVTPIARLTELRKLYLAGTSVSDIAPLANLDALQVLSLGHSAVDDVSALEHLSGLEILY